MYAVHAEIDFWLRIVDSGSRSRSIESVDLSLSSSLSIFCQRNQGLIISIRRDS